MLPDLFCLASQMTLIYSLSSAFLSYLFYVPSAKFHEAFENHRLLLFLLELLILCSTFVSSKALKIVLHILFSS